MIRTMKRIDGKVVWDPPYTASEDAAKKELFSDMCRSRIAPGGNGTDRTFMNSNDVLHHGLGDHPQWLQEMIVKRARKAGINITGKVFKGGLGRAENPDAWVGGTSDVLEVCRRRNLTCEGIVNHRGHEEMPSDDMPLAADLVAEAAQHYVAEDPNWAKKPQELREMVIDRHGDRDAKKTERPKRGAVVRAKKVK